MKINWEVYMADWTDKSFSNTYSRISYDILSQRNPEKLKDYKYDIFNDPDEKENKNEEKSEEKFDFSQVLDTDVSIKCSYLVICCGDFVLHEDLVPKGEGHDTLIPAGYKIIKHNYKRCKKRKKWVQFRTDGFGKNKNCGLKLQKEFYYHHLNQDTKESKLISDCGFTYDFVDLMIRDWIKVIYILFIYNLNIIYILFCIL